MKTIQVRLSDQEAASLQEKAKLTGRSLSEVVREILCPGNDEKRARLPASEAQITALSGQLDALAEAVRRLETRGENGSLPEKNYERLIDPIRSQGSLAGSEKNERDLSAVLQILGALMELLQEQKTRPFDLDLPFVQATFMACFTLARGSFADSPEQWESFKDEAWLRAFHRESEATCTAKS